MLSKGSLKADGSTDSVDHKGDMWRVDAPHHFLPSNQWAASTTLSTAKGPKGSFFFTIQEGSSKN